MVIGDDPKFRQLSNQGICSLEIRKPSSFDGGVYTCRAKNDQGEAVVSCKLEVKRMYQMTGTKEELHPPCLHVVYCHCKNMHYVNQLKKTNFFFFFISTEVIIPEGDKEKGK